MSLVNLFSNIWLYFIDKKEDYIIYERIKQAHGISQELCIDNLVKFWTVPSKGEIFAKEIDANLKVQRDSKLVATWDTLGKRILALLIQGAEPLIIYSSNPASHECLIGLYLYILKKHAQLPIEKSVKSLSSKIAGINYKMSDDMKKIIYQACY